MPEALDWLDTCRLTDAQIAENPLLEGNTHPTFVELGTNRSMFTHRFGSNIRNGSYYFDHDHHDTLSHYSSGRAVDVAALRATHAELAAMSDAEVAELRARSPLTPGVSAPLPTYYSVRDIQLSDLLKDAPFDLPGVTDAQAAGLVAGLGARDYWLTPIEAVTNPYHGPGSTSPYDGSVHEQERRRRDDTSPYDPQEPPEEPPYEPRERPLGISTSAHTANMAKLIAYVDAR